jgi:3-oxoacyl-[acyl-carrier-protein] synthase II
VIGEGAAVLLLESETSAAARGAEVWGELAGHAVTNEAHNIMAPRPDGSGMAQPMRLAMRRAGILPGEVDYINAHGTSTPLNDKLETLAIKQVFGEDAHRIPVSSAKSMIGHTAGACGAVEAAITLQSLRHGHLTPTINYRPDPELDLDYVPNESRPTAARVALSNSFGFGGCNVTLALRGRAAAPGVPGLGGGDVRL